MSVVRNFMPQCMSTVSVSLYIYMGHTFSLAESMEIFMQFNNIQGNLSHLLQLNEQIIDLRLVTRRIQEFLQQDEVSVNQLISKSNDHEDAKQS